MATFQTEALILRAVDFGESDRILHLLVPDMGRLTAIAKGARRSVRRFPVCGSRTRPSRPKSTSASSPAATGAMRTVVRRSSRKPQCPTAKRWSEL